MSDTDQTIDEFRATRLRMTAHQYGDLVGEESWKDEPETALVLVYNNSWYIDICADGRFQLTLENQGWITGPDTTLEELEEHLFEFATTYS